MLGVVQQQLQLRFQANPLAFCCDAALQSLFLHESMYSSVPTLVHSVHHTPMGQYAK